MKKHLLSVIIILSVALLFFCRKAPKEDETWETYSLVLTQFQHEVFSVMSAQLPEDRQLLTKYRDYSLMGVEDQANKFYYLLEYHPERIIRDQKIFNFVNFKWTNEDRKALHESDPEAAELEKNRFDLWREIEPHWTQLRKRMDAAYKSDEYKEIQKQHIDRLNEVKKMLKK